MAASRISPTDKPRGSGRYCIIVSGLPASGKTTVGSELSQRLQLPLLDKDNYLENLFEARGYSDEATRRRLSRESDLLFQRDATIQGNAVLVSHWRPRNSSADSGTPLDWLTESFDRIVELYCACPVDTAAQRFITRRRHPGHCDATRKAGEIETWFEAYAGCLPLSVGALVRVPSDREIDFTRLHRRVEKIIGNPRA